MKNSRRRVTTADQGCRMAVEVMFRMLNEAMGWKLSEHSGQRRGETKVIGEGACSVEAPVSVPMGSPSRAINIPASHPCLHFHLRTLTPSELLPNRIPILGSLSSAGSGVNVSCLLSRGTSRPRHPLLPRCQKRKEIAAM